MIKMITSMGLIFNHLLTFIVIAHCRLSSSFLSVSQGDYLSKPINIPALVETLGRLLLDKGETAERETEHAA